MVLENPETYPLSPSLPKDLTVYFNAQTLSGQKGMVILLSLCTYLSTAHFSIIKCRITKSFTLWICIINLKLKAQTQNSLYTLNSHTATSMAVCINQKLIIMYILHIWTKETGNRAHYFSMGFVPCQKWKGCESLGYYFKCECPKAYLRWPKLFQPIHKDVPSWR